MSSYVQAGWLLMTVAGPKKATLIDSDALYLDHYNVPTLTSGGMAASMMRKITNDINTNINDTKMNETNTGIGIPVIPKCTLKVTTTTFPHSHRDDCQYDVEDDDKSLILFLERIHHRWASFLNLKSRREQRF